MLISVPLSELSTEVRESCPLAISPQNVSKGGGLSFSPGVLFLFILCRSLSLSLFLSLSLYLFVLPVFVLPLFCSSSHSHSQSASSSPSRPSPPHCPGPCPRSTMSLGHPTRLTLPACPVPVEGRWPSPSTPRT